MLRDSTAYIEELLYEANFNGDGERFSAVIDELIVLLSSVKDSLTAGDVKMLREGDRRGAISNIFSRFGDEEFAVIEKAALAIEKKASYDKVATKIYGESYTAYKKAGKTSTLTELRAAVGTDGFYDTLEGYIFGISPAFSYGMKK